MPLLSKPNNFSPLKPPLPLASHLSTQDSRMSLPLEGKLTPPFLTSALRINSPQVLSCFETDITWVYKISVITYKFGQINSRGIKSTLTAPPPRPAKGLNLPFNPLFSITRKIKSQHPVILCKQVHGVYNFGLESATIRKKGSCNILIYQQSPAACHSETILCWLRHSCHLAWIQSNIFQSCKQHHLQPASYRLQEVGTQGQ